VNERERRRLDRRERIFRRDGHVCVYCGEPTPAEELTLDHVEPRVKGGDASEGNLVACCRHCNALKGGQPAWAFLARSSEHRAHFLAALERCNERWARGVWPRLVRAIHEAAS